MSVWPFGANQLFTFYEIKVWNQTPRGLGTAFDTVIDQKAQSDPLHAAEFSGQRRRYDGRPQSVSRARLHERLLGSIDELMICDRVG